MSITVNFDEALSEELRREASYEHVSPEDLARRLMHDALEQRISRRRWHDLNRRRLELIAKKYRIPLTPGENAELVHLQNLASERASPIDQEMHHTAKEIQCELENLPTEPAP